MHGTWTTTSINGKDADIFVPDSPRSERAVIHLHGHGLTTLKDNETFSRELNQHGLRVVCPHGQRSWWLPEICEEFDLEITPFDYVRNNVVSWIGENWGVRTPNIALTGISMGGQGVIQLGYRCGRDFPIIAAISPAVDFHQWWGTGLPLDAIFKTQEAARQQTAILHLQPLNWPRHQLIVCDPRDTDWIDSSERLASKLYSSGIPFESDFETSNGGHSWDYFNMMAPRVVKFVSDACDSESMRIV
ncbi:MAG: alpha/beta hydrolase-fold protein [Planctomycetota bacterium]|nr:alpha/beta hydrolase-fold protein [Planctomycetota bacterium]